MIYTARTNYHCC